LGQAVIISWKVILEEGKRGLGGEERKEGRRGQRRGWTERREEVGGEEGGNGRRMEGTKDKGGRREKGRKR
jgi:hypothetical protein